MASLPDVWQRAFERDRPTAKSGPADPLPERRLARLLAGFIAAGLLYLVLPGTLLGVWNLIGISSRLAAAAVAPVWIQAHGHAQLFGWVGSFMIGISLYTLPKFRGAWIRSLAVGWIMLALWAGAVGVRWASTVWDWHWRALWPVSGAAELLVALLLIWQTTAPSRRRPAEQGWAVAVIFTGFCGLVLTLAWQLAAILQATVDPVIPAARNTVVLNLALWGFCFPVAWGFSGRFLPSFLGLRKPRKISARIGLGALTAGIALQVLQVTAPILFAIAAVAACLSLRVFEPAGRTAKVAGVDPRYPWFARAAFGWLVAAALLPYWSGSAGIAGASRHAFTVGFLSTLILSIGPRILPAFLNSRELWSTRLMLASLVTLSAGCALRVISEPLAYAGVSSAAWRVLPVSAFIELAAMLLFAVNLGMTVALPMPAWIERRVITENLTLYWCISSYPGTRRLLVDAGLETLKQAQDIPRTLTLREAAEADGLDPAILVARLRDYFQKRLARALR